MCSEAAAQVVNCSQTAADPKRTRENHVPASFYLS